MCNTSTIWLYRSVLNTVYISSYLGSAVEILLYTCTMTINYSIQFNKVVMIGNALLSDLTIDDLLELCVINWYTVKSRIHNCNQL